MRVGFSNALASIVRIIILGIFPFAKMEHPMQCPHLTGHSRSPSLFPFRSQAVVVLEEERKRRKRRRRDVLAVNGERSCKWAMPNQSSKITDYNGSIF